MHIPFRSLTSWTPCPRRQSRQYPDVHPAGPAARHYTAQEARDVVGVAREVLEHCERQSLEA